MGRGCYTDDGQMLLALAAGLVNTRGALKASHAATEFAKAFDPNRGYGGSAEKILAKLQSQLAEGPLPPTMAAGPGAQSGSYGNGGAMRVAPLGLVYRHAPVPVLEAVLVESLIPTHHLHPWAIEGALTQALAVAHLSKQEPAATQPPAPAPDGPAAGAAEGRTSQPPEAALQLLRVLKEQLQGRSDVMQQRLAAMEAGLEQLYSSQGGPKQQQQSWRDYFASPAWAHELSVAQAVAPGEGPEGFQIKGTDAVAAAVWACVAHWQGSGADAIVAAVHYGGDTDTIACLTGALVGALRGSSWLPEGWQSQLEADAAGVSFYSAAVQAALQDGLTEAGGGAAQPAGAAAAEEPMVYTTRDMGRQAAVVLAQLLARLDCRTA